MNSDATPTGNPIVISPTFFDHPKTILLKRKLGNEAIEPLLRLWMFAAQHKTDGWFKFFSNEEIEAAAKWDGEPHVFVEVLTELGWLADLDGFKFLNDWCTYQDKWIGGK